MPEVERMETQGVNGMLVLTRKFGQEIVIGDDIKVVVKAIGSNKVRIGIEAPEGVRIVRSEIMERDDEPDCS